MPNFRRRGSSTPRGWGRIGAATAEYAGWCEREGSRRGTASAAPTWPANWSAAGGGGLVEWSARMLRERLAGQEGLWPWWSSWRRSSLRRPYAATAVGVGSHNSGGLRVIQI
eukprot:1182694-Prorocentrum_minimum.AAC.3